MKIEQANKLINKHENEDIPKITSELEQIKDSVLQNKPIVISDDVPVGSIMFVDSTTILTDSWLKCDGGSLSKAQYPELFEVIGYKHGGSDDNFNLPNLVVENLVVDGINEALDTIDSKVVKSQIGIIKAKQRAKDMVAVAQEWTNFKENGGEIGGTIMFPKGITRQISQMVNLRSKDYLQRSGLSNYNGYPCWASIIEDPDDVNNTNGLLFMLGSGAGDSYNDNYLRPLKMGYAQKNNIGSSTVPWDNVYLTGSNKSTNGYTKLPNGFILQWGEIVLSGASAQSSNAWPSFPVSFPNACINITGNASPRDTNTNAVACNFYIETSSNASFHYRLGGATNSTTTKIQWSAIGY